MDRKTAASRLDEEPKENEDAQLLLLLVGLRSTAEHPSDLGRSLLFLLLFTEQVDNGMLLLVVVVVVAGWIAIVVAVAIVSSRMRDDWGMFNVYLFSKSDFVNTMIKSHSWMEMRTIGIGTREWSCGYPNLFRSTIEFDM